MLQTTESPIIGLSQNGQEYGKEAATGKEIYSNCELIKKKEFSESLTIINYDDKQFVLALGNTVLTEVFKSENELQEWVSQPYNMVELSFRIAAVVAGETVDIWKAAQKLEELKNG